MRIKFPKAWVVNGISFLVPPVDNPFGKGILPGRAVFKRNVGRKTTGGIVGWGNPAHSRAGSVVVVYKNPGYGCGTIKFCNGVDKSSGIAVCPGYGGHRAGVSGNRITPVDVDIAYRKFKGDGKSGNWRLVVGQTLEVFFWRECPCIVSSLIPDADALGKGFRLKKEAGEKIEKPKKENNPKGRFFE